MEKTNLGFLDRFDNFSKELQKESKKDSKGYGYKFMALDDILKLISEKSQKFQITFVQYMSCENGSEVVVTKIVDKASNKIKIESKKMVVNDSTMKNQTQANGSAITYARRYSLLTAFKFLPEEDSDGVSKDSNKTVTLKPKTSKKFTSETTLDLTPPDHML